MKTKLSLLLTILTFLITACSGFEDKATLNLYFGGGSSSHSADYKAASLPNWPPKDDTELASLIYDIALTGPSGEKIEEKGITADTGTISFTVNPGKWTIEVTAYSDYADYADHSVEKQYAHCMTTVTLKPGQNNIPITMRRAGAYEIYIRITPSEITVVRSGREYFYATTGCGSMVSSVDLAPYFTYKWSVSGNKSSDTKIIDGNLYVDSKETASKLIVKVESDYDSSICDTATVNVVDLVNAQTPVITKQPQSAYYSGPSISVNDLTVEATVTDGGTLSYQWFRIDSTGSGYEEVILGATGLSCTPTNSVGTVYYYYVVVTNTNTNPEINGKQTVETTSNVAIVTVASRAADITVSIDGGAAIGYAQLSDAFMSISDNQTATVTVSAFTYSDPISISGTNKTITLVSQGDKTISLNTSGTSGSLFTVNSGVTLKLGGSSSGELLLAGIYNNAALVTVDGGTLELNDHVKITSNNNYRGNGGGVSVSPGGRFIMSGGSIESNSAGRGGGVCVFTEGRFEMSGGSIEDNSAMLSDGGGVYVGLEGPVGKYGYFIMSGGYIYGSDGTSYSPSGARNIAKIAGGAIYLDTYGGIAKYDGAYTKYGDIDMSGNLTLPCYYTRLMP